MVRRIREIDPDHQATNLKEKVEGRGYLAFSIIRSDNNEPEFLPKRRSIAPKDTFEVSKPKEMEESSLD